MATLATQKITRAGLNPAYASAAGGGDEFTPGGRTFLHVKNGHTSAQTVTVATPGNAIDDVAIADLAVSVPNAGERMIGPFPGSYFANSAIAGRAAITYSGVVSLTVAVVELP